MKKSDTYFQQIIQPTDANINAHSHAELCPVCGGSGKYKTAITNLNATSTTSVTEHTCHGCKGTGWVTVIDYQAMSIK